MQVEVEERDIDGDGNILQRRSSDAVDTKVNDVPMIRDSSRNRLQRLGALYSETENLSSPINRNESRFLLEDDTDTQPCGMNTTRQITRTGKLNALANSIKTWEDDLSHPDAKQHQQRNKEPSQMASSSAGAKVASSSPTKTGTIPKVRRDDQPSRTPAVTVNAKVAEPKKSKELKWDQNVMDALEQQGFTRRESTTHKLTYDYKKEPKPVSTTVTKTISSNLATAKPKATVPETCAKSPIKVSKGMVSGRAAIFENQQSSTGPARSHKDPAEMSLKDRLALFERNKGAALIPKASFGMSASSKQISNVETVAPAVRRELKEYNATVTNASSSKYTTSEPSSKIDSYNKAVMAESKASGSCIKNTVAALMSKGATISSAEISQDIRKQREREMNVLLNRFNKPDSCDSPEPQRPTAMAYESARLVGAVAASTPPTPPVPPPMPSTNFHSNAPASTSVGHVETKCIVKRKSAEKESSEDSNQRRRNAQQLFDETKRKKVSNTQTTARLYPVLSDIESTTATESDHDNCTTATVSSDNDQHYKRYQANDSYEVDEDR